MLPCATATTNTHISSTLSQIVRNCAEKSWKLFIKMENLISSNRGEGKSFLIPCFLCIIFNFHSPPQKLHFPGSTLSAIWWIEFFIHSSIARSLSQQFNPSSSTVNIKFQFHVYRYTYFCQRWTFTSIDIHSLSSTHPSRSSMITDVLNQWIKIADNVIASFLSFALLLPKIHTRFHDIRSDELKAFSDWKIFDFPCATFE